MGKSTHWKRWIGGQYSEFSESVTIASNGAIYISGYTSSDLDGQINSGAYDAFLSKYASDGTKQWTQLLGGSSWDKSNAVATASDGSIYISGTTSGDLDGEINSGDRDAFLTKYASDGTKQWTQLFSNEDGDSTSTSVATGSDGAICISGYGYTETTESRDAFLIKTNDVQNIAPTLTKAGGTLIYTAGDDATVIDSKLKLSDADSSKIASATISISSGFVATEDVLAFTNTSKITGAYNAATGILSLTGLATKPQYKDALESVTYKNLSSNPTTSNRTVSWVVNDGIDNSSAVTSTISIKGIWNQISERSIVTKTTLANPITIGNKSYLRAILGTASKDKIKGTAFDEIIAGGASKDILKGHRGADAFVFNTPGGFGNAQMDIIIKFSIYQGDSLVLARNQFSSLESISFHAAPKIKQLKQLASSSDAAILYLEKSGKLFYNENGSDDGFGNGGLFAKLKDVPVLGAANFRIV